MANLYELNKQLTNFEFEVDEETGELKNAPDWDALELAYGEKVDNIACYIKDINGDVEKFKAEEAALAKRRKSLERKAEYLRKLLLNNMNGEKYNSTRCTVSFRHSEVVNISPDVTVLPKEFTRVKTTVEPDKPAIKAALKAGQVIDGCTLVDSVSIQIK